MNTQWKYISILIILIVWSGAVFATLQWFEFDKNYTETDDTTAKRIYERKQGLSQRGSSLSLPQRLQWGEKTTNPTTLTEATISQAIKETITPNTTSYSNSNTMSFDDIIASISTDSLNNSITSTKELEEQFQATQDPTIAIALITKLSKEYNYARAYELFQALDSTTIKTMNPHLIMRILFNSSLINQQTQDFTTIENMIVELSTSNLLQSKDAERYKAMILLLKGDKNAFITNLPQYSESDISDIKIFVDDIRQKIAQSTQGNDIPDYYSDGMITLWMFQYGYPYVAQQLSLTLLLEYPNYVLPKQILAYSHMILHEWSQAQSYFLQLIESDQKNISTYQFFAGVCSYWLGKYTDAILYLNQIPQDKIVSDATRYKILSYLAIKDRANIAKQMKSLLWHTDINNSDMMLVREQTIFEPFMSDQSYSILQQDPTLLELYLERCTNQQLDSTICNIGQIARDVSLRSTNYSDTYLKTIISQFPRSYMYYILWEYYFTQGDMANAQKSFVSAMTLTSNPAIREKITNKIKTLL